MTKCRLSKPGQWEVHMDGAVKLDDTAMGMQTMLSVYTIYSQWWPSFHSLLAQVAAGFLRPFDSITTMSRLQLNKLLINTIIEQFSQISTVPSVHPWNICLWMSLVWPLPEGQWQCRWGRRCCRELCWGDESCWKWARIEWWDLRMCIKKSIELQIRTYSISITVRPSGIIESVDSICWDSADMQYHRVGRLYM